MIISKLISILISVSFLIPFLPVYSDTQFEEYLNDFYKKQEMASKLLKEIETDMKNGSKERVCLRQREAAMYGIEGTQSLLKAFEISGTTYQLEDIKAGLNKWRNLSEAC